jgi:hypothetical protein
MLSFHHEVPSVNFIWLEIFKVGRAEAHASCNSLGPLPQPLPYGFPIKHRWRGNEAVHIFSRHFSRKLFDKVVIFKVAGSLLHPFKGLLMQMQHAPSNYLGLFKLQHTAASTLTYDSIFSRPGTASRCAVNPHSRLLPGIYFMVRQLCIFVLTLSLLMSYIYRAPCKARNVNVVYIWTYVWQRWKPSFYLLHNVSTLNQCRKFSCHSCVNTLIATKVTLITDGI